MSKNTRELIPLSRNDPSRFLMWIFAFIIYLTILSLTTLLVFENALNRWNSNDTLSLTIQLMPVQDVEFEEQIDKVKNILEEFDGIKDIYILSTLENLALIKPWIETQMIPSDVPLPRLIDVQFKDGSGLSAKTLTLKLNNSISNFHVIDSKQLINNVMDTNQSIRLLAVAFVILISLTAVVSVFFCTRLGFSIHKNVIELLHLIGARDSYLAAQFQRQAIILGLRGSILGCTFSVATLYGTWHVVTHLNASVFPSNLLPYWKWLMLTVVPIITIIIAGITARLTVVKELKKMYETTIMERLN